jgi:hypothetical protein
MYATLSYDLNAGQHPVVDVRAALVVLFDGRATCDLLADTFISEIDDTADYLSLVKDLRRIGKDFPGQFQFVITLHRSGDPLRSNGTFPKTKAKTILQPGDGE